jgi:hypothetical protein
MQKPLYLGLFLSLCACVSSPSLKNDLLDSSTVPSLSEAQEVRLGDIRYGKQRLEEREAISWSFQPDGSFQRGAPRGEDSGQIVIRAKVYEVGQAERGKYRGFALERWDVSEERPGAKPKHFHHYFFRSPNRLVHLPRMAKGEARPLWEKGKRGQEVLNYLNSRWSVSLGQDVAYEIPELSWHRHVSVPGEGTFRAAANGESLSEIEAKNGGATALSVLPKGREVYRVPGDWLVCVFPDGLAVPLLKE